MEREKRELQEFIGIKKFSILIHLYFVTHLDKDNKRMQDKINSENEERKKKEEEMKRRLQEAQEVNGIISFEI